MARMWLSTLGFGYARLDVFLDASTSAPHLQLHISVLPTGAYNIYFDVHPRCDLLVNHDYLRRVYLTPPPGCARSLSDVVAACLRQPAAFEPYISRDGAMRVVMASPAMMHMIVAPGRKGADRVRRLAREYAEAWVAIATAMPLPGALDAQAVRCRDVIIREGVKSDPDKNLVPVLGAAGAEMLMQLTAGTRLSA